MDYRTLVEPVAIHDPAGNPIDGYVSAGGYRSAASTYEENELEPRITVRPEVVLEATVGEWRVRWDLELERVAGAEGLAEEVSAIEARTAGVLQYVGEWHSHPERCSAQAGGTDVEALETLGRQMAFHGLPALMFIVGRHDRRWFITSL